MSEPLTDNQIAEVLRQHNLDADIEIVTACYRRGSKTAALECEVSEGRARHRYLRTVSRIYAQHSTVSEELKSKFF